jgi:hypothetical protein
MPNWCSNYIVISGDENKISQLKNIIEDVPKSKEDNRIIFESLIGESTSMDWFGTKWDVSYNDCQFDFNDDHIIMMPQTAWSPPVGFVSNLCKMYGVTAVMDYDESGCNFCGRAHIDINGEVDEEEFKFNEGKYHFDNEYFWESLVESHMEYSLDEDKTKDQFLLDYPYVNEDDLKELGEMYDKYMIENLKTENNE